jgi:hypothetical protein
MNEIECLEKQLELMRMCEGTKLKWWECVQLQDGNKWINRYTGPIYKYHFPNGDRFALAIVEDKPVFEGDLLWDVVEEKAKYASANKRGKHSSWEDMSWNPIKHRTVMVELTVKDASCIAEPNWITLAIVDRLEAACCKALEELK